MKYFRKKNIIRDQEGNTEKFISINKAKRESRRLQMMHDGALGRGTVRDVTKS